MSPIPHWAALALGVLMVIAGVILVTRLFASLGVLILLVSLGFVLSGLGVLTSGPPVDRRLVIVVGVAWIGVGVGILLWPGLGLRGLAFVVAARSGVPRISGWRRPCWVSRA